MSKREKLLQKVLSGQSDSNISFKDLVLLLEHFRFNHRQEGSHHIFTMPGIHERVNLQSDGSKAKRYQVKQIREIITKYGFKLYEEE